MKYRAQRYPTRFQVTLRVGAVGFKSTITSISAMGARITLDQPLAVGQGISLDYAGQRVPAKVRWVRNAAAGVTFDRALPKAELERLRSGLPGIGARPSHRVGFAALRH
ncbi:PilZ domain-containing protein [Thalassorhabdomicrobium marinisediminis]|uniref:PilZ domain-containing protein n=1 Tax=Thalassorhabdomicrobium marinisediminis TaxID=2170577 RepID=A0A2T7FYK1_9RHOB|nr:PilZ domain-containing protein [Thalassorhabdomicrobium marinisediminis]PVA07241.1 hypothetical protein DC363_05170 [Thalassorhabdomicrobium marinisediminis]